MSKSLPHEQPPVCLFETHIIRRGRHEDFDMYRSWKAAEKGHQRAVDQMLAEGRTITWSYPGTKRSKPEPQTTLH